MMAGQFCRSMSWLEKNAKPNKKEFSGTSPLEPRISVADLVKMSWLTAFRNHDHRFATNLPELASLDYRFLRSGHRSFRMRFSAVRADFWVGGAVPMAHFNSDWYPCAPR